jgi:hypothetical protein
LIIGTVVENTTGAEHGGVVYDRWLIVRLADGGRIDVFDPGPPIGDPLVPGTPAELALVAAVPTGVRVDGAGEPNRIWHGEVVDTAWRAAPDTLEVVRARPLRVHPHPRSGGPTIDVKLPTSELYKVHVNPWPPE